jgi:hypothetical protein
MGIDGSAERGVNEAERKTSGCDIGVLCEQRPRAVSVVCGRVSAFEETICSYEGDDDIEDISREVQ